jgi:hypothetical protein
VWSPICGELDGPALCHPVTGTEVGASVATTHPVEAKTKKSTTIASRSKPPAAASRFHLVSDCGALLRLRRLPGVELPIALLDAASPLVPRNDDTDMVRTRPLA